MRISFRTFIALAGFTLLATPLFAADETYPIQLFHAQRYGYTQDVHYVIEKRDDTIITVPNQNAKTTTHELKAEVSGRTQAIKVERGGVPSGIVFLVKKMTGTDGTSLIKPGTLIEVTRTNTDSTFKSNDNTAITTDATAVLKLMFPKLSPAGADDRLYGSTSPRKVGESWRIDPDAVVTSLADDGMIIDPKDIHGQTAFTSAETINGTPALHLVVSLSADNVEVQNLNIHTTGGLMKMVTTYVEPVDPKLAPSRLIRTLDVSSRTATTGQKIVTVTATKSHLSLNLTSTLVPSAPFLMPATPSANGRRQ